MPLPVKLQEVIEALEMTGDSTSYFLDRRTGEIELITEEDWSAAENNDLISTYPEWQRGSILKAREIQSTDHFIELPKWNRFEHQQVEDLAVEWLEANEIPFTRDDEIGSSSEM